MMKTKTKRIGFTLSGAFLLLQTAHAVPTANGDLIIGFYQVIGGSVQPDTYVFNLGKAATYRENLQSNVAVSAINPAISASIGADLSIVFGEDWAESGTVYWSVFGGADQTTVGVVDGDNFRTPYISLPVSSFTVGRSTTTPTINQNSRGTVSNQIASIRAGANGTGAPVPSGNPSGAVIPASGILDTSVDSFFPPTVPSQLSLGTELRGLFDAGTVPNSAGLEGALDLYRYVGSTTGTDPTSGFGGGNAALGVGQYFGTLTIDASGNLKIFGAAPAPSGNYNTFATANSFTGGPAGDTDNDGISNLLEYALDTNLTGSGGSFSSFNGSLLNFTKRAAAVTNGDLTYVIEISDDLGIADPWAPLGGTSNLPASISGTLPASQSKVFGRLKVTSNVIP